MKHSFKKGCFLALVFSLGAFFSFPARADNAGLDFKALHQSYLSQYASTIEDQSTSGNSDTYYFTSYFINGILSAAEGSGDPAILQKAIYYIDKMKSKAKVLSDSAHPANLWGYKAWDSYGTTYPSWGPYLVPKMLDHHQAISPIARAAAIIKKNPQFDATYGAKAQEYIDFVNNSLVDHWYNKSNGIYNAANISNWQWSYGQIPWLSAAQGGWGTYKLWNDSCSHLGTLMAYMYQATGEEKYKQTAERIGNDFKNKHLFVNGSGWIWDDFDMTIGEWEGTGQVNADAVTVPYVDTSHGNREPMMMVAMYEAGIVFSKSDVEKMANTLTDILWNGSTDTPRFANYINGSNAEYDHQGAWTNGNIYAGWAFLGKYSDTAQTALAYTLKRMGDGQTIGNNTNLYGFVALSGHLLRNSSTSPPSTPKYKCSGTSCVRDDVSGTFTDSNCNNSCSASPEENLVQNPDFSQGTTNWTFYTNGAGTFTDDSQSAKVEITTPGNNVQLYQTGITLEPETNYTLTFSAYSNTAHDLSAQILKHTSPYTSYGLNQNVDLTSTSQNYTLNFKTQNFTQTTTDTRLRLWFSDTNQTGDIFHIDNVSLKKATTLTYKNTDLNQDTYTNVTDLGILMSDFMKTLANLANPRSDIDGDGTVTIKDVGILMGGWE